MTVEQAAVLAAGLGSRMGRHTATAHKSSLLVDGVPLLVHVFDELRSAGITRFVVILGHASASVEPIVAKYFDGTQDTQLVATTTDPNPMGNALESLRHARALLDGRPFLWTESSIICVGGDYRRLADVDLAESGAMSALVTSSHFDEAPRHWTARVARGEVVRLAGPDEINRGGPTARLVTGVGVSDDRLFAYTPVQPGVLATLQRWLREGARVLDVPGTRFRHFTRPADFGLSE